MTQLRILRVLMHPGGIRHGWQAGIFCACLLLAGCGRSSVPGSNAASDGKPGTGPESLRMKVCTVWVVTNSVTGEVRYAANALATGYVSKTGERSFASIRRLAKALKGGIFGPSPEVLATIDCDPNERDNYGVRRLSQAELTELRKLGVTVQVGL